MRAIFLLLMVLLGMPALAGPLDPGVAAAYADLREAWRKLDAAGVMRHFAPSVHLLDGRHQDLNYAGVQATVEEALKGALSCEIEYQVKDWRPQGETIVARVHQVRTIHYPSKSVCRVVEREDHWMRTPSGWQFFDVHFLHQEVTITSGSSSRRPNH